MNIYVRLKSVGKRRPVLEAVPRAIPDSVSSLRALLTELVCQEVALYNKKEPDAQILSFLTCEEVEAQSAAGKVGFGRIYSENKAREWEAVTNALQCYEDGLVRVFLEEEELINLDEPLTLRPGDTLTLMRLTFLAGCMW